MDSPGTTITGWLGQGLIYALFAAVIGLFSAAPTYRPLPPDHAVIRLSFSHASEREFECRKLSPQEIAALAPNMRNALDCPRGRVPVQVKLELDGETLYSARLIPAGLSNDGAVTAYEGFVVPSGQHRVAAYLLASMRKDGNEYEYVRDVSLAPAEILVVDFDAAAGGFEFR